MSLSRWGWVIQPPCYVLPSEMKVTLDKSLDRNWYSTWKAQKALEKISGFASVISESYNQDDAGEIEDIMKLASQMGRSLNTNDDAWLNFVSGDAFLSCKITVNRRNVWLKRVFSTILTSSVNNLVRSYAKVTFFTIAIEKYSFGLHEQRDDLNRFDLK